MAAMKRDQSLIFTSVPEEETDHQNVVSVSNIPNPKPQNRPKFLNLRNKTTDFEQKEKQEEEAAPYTPFRGQTSVCSTPMTDIKKVLHPAVVSICTNPNEEQNLTDSVKTESVNSILSAVSEKSHTSLHSTGSIGKLFKLTPYVTIERNLFDKKKFSSMWEVREKLKSFIKRITMKYYNVGLTTINKAITASDEESPRSEDAKRFERSQIRCFQFFVVMASLYHKRFMSHT